MSKNKRKSKININNFIRHYIWFSALDGDLVFMAIIDTLFLSIVKGLTPSQITLFTTVPAAIGIFIQPYILKIIHNVGNTISVRISAICLLIASIIITFGTNIYILLFGKVFYEVSFVFQNMCNIMLKNNLIYSRRKNEYVTIRNKSSIAYAVITAVIAFVAGYLFNLNHYLPMFLNIGVCVIACVISFFMKDVTKNDKIRQKGVQKSSVKLSLIVYTAILCYAFFYTAVCLGQSNSKLFIQYQLNDYFSTEKTVAYFSSIIALSRISRIVANVVFDRIYKKLKDKVNLALCGAFILALLCIVLSNFINTNIYWKFGLMISGFCIILAVRDPFKIYIQDLILRVSEPAEQQTLFAYLELGKKIGTTLMGFAASAVLLKFTVFTVVLGATVISLMAWKATYRLFVLVKRMNVLQKVKV